MKTLFYRPFAFALSVAALLTFATVAAAQTKSPLLNTIELKKLVTSDAPADHARLHAHFVALADRYVADARRHEAMAQAYVGNRNPGLVTTMRNHCTQLKDLATRSAAILRDVAAYHDKLAAGAPATLPAGASRFEAGEGTPGPTEKELVALATNAKAAADHKALEEYFLTEAKRHAAEADTDAALALMYRSQPSGRPHPEFASNFDRLETLERQTAAQATAAAQMHKDLAGVAR